MKREGLKNERKDRVGKNRVGLEACLTDWALWNFFEAWLTILNP